MKIIGILAIPFLSMSEINIKELHKWCKVPADKLVNHPDLKIPFRLVEDSAKMGEVMARDLVNEINAANNEGRPVRAIVPCGPKSWYAPFTRIVNEEKISLRK